MKRTILTALVVIMLATSLAAENFSEDQVKIKKTSWGVGFGIPYGILGSNVDYNVASNLDLSMGFGTTVLAGIGYNFGFKYHFAQPGVGFRPRVGAYYGVNAMVVKESPWGLIDEGESFTGLTLTVGGQWMWGNKKSNGLDFDLALIASTGLDVDKLNMQGYDVSEPGRIKISVGYRHAF